MNVRNTRECMDTDSRGFVTVIPVDYTRHRGFPQPPEPYSDYSTQEPNNSYNHIDNGSKAIETLGYGLKNNSAFSKTEWEKKEEAIEGKTETYSQSMKICIHLMTNISLHMELEDGINVTVQDLLHTVLTDDQMKLPRSAVNVFSLWMTSGLLELQLKLHHKPINVRAKWLTLLSKYAHASDSRQRRDEPVLRFQRNVYFSKLQEEKIKDERVLELLYTEARNNILEGRYPCELSHYIMLGSIQARIELGPYNPQVHTLHFFRENHGRFLPAHLKRNSSWTSWLRLSSKDSPDVRLLEHYKRLPERKLQKKYLEFCWSLPYYGSAFFQGQIEQPVRGLTSLITHQDIHVLVGINSQGVYVINTEQCILLLGLKYEELSWDFAKPSQEDNPDCLPCLFLQFRVVENGTRVSKILQVFSKQAVMMDALITGFVEDLKQKTTSTEDIERSSVFDYSTDADDVQFSLGSSLRREPLPCFLGNKLSKLTLATFDEEGRCIGQMGSWSFSY